MKRARSRTATGLAYLALATLALAFAWCTFVAFSYFLAIYQDRRCFTAGTGADRAAVEACLFLATEHACAMRAPADPERPGETCVEYRVLGIDPIRVYFDDAGRTRTRVSAYE